ncbi:MAG: DUF3352 domain-containing protein [Armatimonadetes bacterium]|nr:DUF3352 domain-containing protein [Armatimonadota bacterium]
MIGKKLVLGSLVSALAIILAGGACIAQQQAPIDIWQLAPPNSVLVAAFDTRPENSSMQALAKVEDPESRELREKRNADLRKAVESFATLFGISLDFAKDIQSWADPQSALVIIPDEKGGMQPIFLIASKDAAAANEALVKLLAPWERVGELIPQPDADYPITAFKTKGVEVYASACGPVVAFSPSKDGLKQALRGGGFPAGSPGDKTLRALSGSLFYAYVDPSLLKQFNIKTDQIPITGLGLGVSAIETGAKVRILGFPNEQGLAMLTQMLASQQSGVLTVNPGIPSTTLAAASLPDLSGVAAMVGILGTPTNPIFSAVQAITDTQISAAVTAVLPTPTGVVSVMTESDQAAAVKLAMIAEGMKQSKVPTKAATICGIPATEIRVSKKCTVYLAQSGKYILLAADAQSLTSAVAAAKGDRPGIAQSDTYKETIAGLGDSNLLTLYLNLAPVQGLGYLADGLGLGEMVPLYGSVAKGLENLQALGAGVGFDGQAASVSLFLRAKPGIGPTIGPAAIAGTAIAAAVLIPVFVRAREAAQVAECANNLKELPVAAHIFAQEHGGKLPTSANWQAQLKPYLKAPVSEMKCPGEEAIYAFNKNLSGANLNKIPKPAETIMFFEAAPGLPNASGRRADALLPHKGRGLFAYVDGHVISLGSVPAQSKWAFAAPKPVKKAPAKKAPAQKKRLK